VLRKENKICLKCNDPLQYEIWIYRNGLQVLDDDRSNDFNIKVTHSCSHHASQKSKTGQLKSTIKETNPTFDIKHRGSISVIIHVRYSMSCTQYRLL
jgi:hypothetical protein